MKNTQTIPTILALVALLSLTPARGAAIPKAYQTLGLSAGWNLVALEGVPLRMEEFLRLKPLGFDDVSRTYVPCTADSVLQSGTVLWIYSPTAQSVEVPLVSRTAAPPVTEPTAIWSLVGVGDEAPSWLGQLLWPFYTWDAQHGFIRAESPEPRNVYWVKAKKPMTSPRIIEFSQPGLKIFKLPEKPATR